MDASLLGRIRSRKVVEWGVAYAAGAWLLFQVLDIMADPWAIPAWTVRVLQVLLGTGFLVTLVLAWYHGDKGRQRVSGPELLLLSGLVVVGGLLARQSGPGSDSQAPADAEGNGGTPSAPSGNADPELRRRLAVLPLTNNTGDPSVQHIVDGLHEAIIYRLGTIRSLDPISRTSVMGYREAPASVREISEQLQVGWIVEGSFTWAVDSVRLTLRLVDAQRDAEEWSGRFGGELSDLMRLEDQIAREVARRLRAYLTPREDSLLALSPRIDPQAGDAYLRARVAGTRAEAVSLLTEAIRLDPGFAAPYGELARQYGEMAFGGANTAETASELYDRVVRLAEQGLQLDSGLASAYTALAEVRYHRDWDWAAGLALFERALEINPSYSVVHMRISAHQAAVGRVDAAIRAGREAQRVDPRWPFAWYGLAQNLNQVGRYEQALLEVDGALRNNPGNRYALVARGRALSRLGRHQEAVEILRSTADSVALVVALTVAGRREEAEALRETFADPSRDTAISPYDLACIFALAGETDRAVEYLQQAADQRVGALMWLNVDPDLDGIRDAPRVQGLLARMRFPRSPG
jgi:TolB-like protein